MGDPWKTSSSDPEADEQRVTIEMGGDNVVVRATAAIDGACTAALVHAVNAASDTDTVVVIDPEPIRCDDTFAAYPMPLPAHSWPDGTRARPVEVVSCGIILIATERTSWAIDVREGRFCRMDGKVDIRFVDPDAWTPVIAVCVTPTQIRALTGDGTLITSTRAPAALAAPVPV